METTACFERNADFIFRKVVDEYVLVPIHQDVATMDCIYSLNEVGAFIWEKLQEKRTQAELQAAILDEFDADAQVLAQDLENFLQEMITIGAICKE